jgi:hypothetical protein
MSDSTVPELPASSASCSTTSTYPAKRMGWLHSFAGLLARAEVAREIGRDAALLILIIAIQEDVQQYQSAPIYFDAELQRATGIRSQKQLDRVRQKAVAAGWLVVDRDAEGDALVARYWTVIPNRLNLFQDSVVVGAVPAKTGLPACEVVHQNDTNDRSGSASQGAEKLEPSIPQILAVSPIQQVAVPVVMESLVTGFGPDPKLTPVIEVQAVEQVADKSPLPVPVVETKVQPQAPRTSISNAGISNAGSSLGKVEQKQVVVALPVSQNEVISILAVYPRRGDFAMATAEIHRALQKIPYTELLPLVNRYAASKKRLGQCTDQTPTATVWFERESWKQDPAKWDRLDS